MHIAQALTPRELPDFLVRVAVRRPVFIWGPPGIGKSSLVQQFAEDVGLECVSLLGSQLAPEDLIGVPQIVEGVSRFCPPRQIARPKPYCLFLDELNACSHEVQKAFYSLILERRVGEYVMPDGSIVLGAGNRAQDNAIVRPMSSALVNRMVHVELRASAGAWLEWAEASGIHPLVVEYLRLRPDHLWKQPPKHEEPFSTPRSWHMLSDILHEHGEDVAPQAAGLVAAGCLTPAHATQFQAFVKQVRGRHSLTAILRGEATWPSRPEDRDLVYFLAHSLRAHLTKELPAERDSVTATHRELAHRAKALLKQLASLSLEIAQMVVVQVESDSEQRGLPSWFLVEVMRDLPRLVGEAGG